LLAIDRAARLPPGPSGARNDAGAWGEKKMTALIVGVVSITLVWIIVIYGSIYVNKNVQ
jgi:hypothetical protein